MPVAVAQNEQRNTNDDEIFSDKQNGETDLDDIFSKGFNEKPIKQKLAWGDPVFDIFVVKN